MLPFPLSSAGFPFAAPRPPPPCNAPHRPLGAALPRPGRGGSSLPCIDCSPFCYHQPSFYQRTRSPRPCPPPCNAPHRLALSTRCCCCCCCCPAVGGSLAVAVLAREMREASPCFVLLCGCIAGGVGWLSPNPRPRPFTFRARPPASFPPRAYAARPARA